LIKSVSLLVNFGDGNSRQA